MGPRVVLKRAVHLGVKENVAKELIQRLLSPIFYCESGQQHRKRLIFLQQYPPFAHVAIVQVF